MNQLLIAAQSAGSDDGADDIFGDASDASDDSCFDHGPAGGGVGDALFAAIHGAGAKSAGPSQIKRSLESLLREAASALSQDASAALSQGCEEADFHGHAGKPHKMPRKSELLSMKHEIGIQYGIAKDLAIANGLYHWSTDWALREYPNMCRTRQARDQFLKNARRWCQNARRGVYGRRGGVTIEDDAAASRQVDAAASSQGAFERHRSGQGTGSTRVKFSQRRRGAGAGGPGLMKMPCVADELFAWFVDTLDNVRGRLPACLLVQKAQMIAKDLVGIHQLKMEAGEVAPHAKLDLPVINYCWLRRWRRTYGVSARMANLRFKAPKKVILLRLRVFWCNMIRVRVLHALLEPEGALAIEGFDQKPLWFTASSQEKTMALRGSRKVIVKENVPMTRALYGDDAMRVARAADRWQRNSHLVQSCGRRLAHPREASRSRGGVAAIPGERILQAARCAGVHLLDIGSLAN